MPACVLCFILPHIDPASFLAMYSLCLSLLLSPSPSLPPSLPLSRPLTFHLSPPGCAHGLVSCYGAWYQYRATVLGTKPPIGVLPAISVVYRATVTT
eukprot:1173866-Rhodomonas_salina.1